MVHSSIMWMAGSYLNLTSINNKDISKPKGENSYLDQSIGILLQKFKYYPFSKTNIFFMYDEH